MNDKTNTSEESKEEIGNADTSASAVGSKDNQPSASSTTKKTSAKKKKKKGPVRKTASSKAKAATSATIALQAKYPRHTLTKALRIPSAVLEQNGGKECSDRDAAAFAGSALNGVIKVEISSALKYGFLERPNPGHVKVSDLARSILRPQQPNEEIEGLRKAMLKAPDIADVYKYYRGENLPDPQFLDNALVDTFKIPAEKLSEFKRIFLDVLKEASLIDESGGKRRILDISVGGGTQATGPDVIAKIGKAVGIAAGDSCFVIMPFAPPLGDYYSKIYEPAIQKAGLNPVRADNDIFATGKIMDQVSRGLRAAKVLVAELTSRNPNVLYELGLAHALEKPVVLISSNEEDVPFDLRHIRVIYYDVNDPFWGEKLIKKVAENILSALNNPEEAIFKQNGN